MARGQDSPDSSKIADGIPFPKSLISRTAIPSLADNRTRAVWLPEWR